jgi:hypothetical protein
MKTGNLVSAGDAVQLRSLKFVDPSLNPANYVGFIPPGTPGSAAGVAWELPAVDGVPGEMLTTDGGSRLYWSTPPGADVFRAEINFLERPDSGNPGKFLVTHSLGEMFVQVTVFNADGKRVVEDELTVIDLANLEIDLTSYLVGGDLPGTWWIVVVG